MKRCSISLVIRETQIETTVRYYFTPTRMAIIKKADNNRCGEDVEKLEPSNHVDGNVKRCSCSGKEAGSSSKGETQESQYDPAIPLVGIYPREWKTYFHTKLCPQMFTAALFTRVKRWNHPKRPSTNGWINKVRSIPTVECYSVLKTNEVLIHGTWMNLEDTEWKKPDKEDHIV